MSSTFSRASFVRALLDVNERNVPKTILSAKACLALGQQSTKIEGLVEGFPGSRDLNGIKDFYFCLSVSHLNSSLWMNTILSERAAIGQPRPYNSLPRNCRKVRTFPPRFSMKTFREGLLLVWLQSHDHSWTNHYSSLKEREFLTPGEWEEGVSLVQPPTPVMGGEGKEEKVTTREKQ